MNAHAYQREEAEMILSKSRDINVVFTLFNSVHYFTYNMLRNYSTVFRMLLIHHSMTLIFITQKTDEKINRFKLCVSFCTALEHSHA